MKETVYVLRKKGTKSSFLEYTLEISEVVEFVYNALRYAIMFDTKDEALEYINDKKPNVEIVSVTIEADENVTFEVFA